jgi:hypothetical protein
MRQDVVSDARIKIVKVMLEASLISLNDEGGRFDGKRWKSWEVRAEFWSLNSMVVQGPGLDEM